jgi:hypothetical protein
MQYAILQVQGGFVVRESHMGEHGESSEYLGADEFWTREPEYATPFKTYREVQTRLNRLEENGR